MFPSHSIEHESEEVTKILDQMQDQFPDRSTPYLVAYPFGHFWGAMRLLFAEKKDVTRDVH